MRSTSSGALGAAGAADDDERGVGPAERGQRAHGDVEALQRLDAPDEQEHGAVAEVEVVQRGAGAVAGAGREEGVVDAGRDELDAAAVGAVEALELVGLGLAGGEDGVGAADHVGLGAHPALGLGIAGLGLHPGERVERRHERQVELVLEAVAGHAREPVVGVEGVDVAEVLEVGGDAVGELVDDVGELLLGQVDRPGVDVDDPEARARRRRPRATSTSARRVKTSACTPAWARADTSSRT